MSLFSFVQVGDPSANAVMYNTSWEDAFVHAHASSAC